MSLFIEIFAYQFYFKITLSFLKDFFFKKKRMPTGGPGGVCSRQTLLAGLRLLLFEKLRPAMAREQERMLAQQNWRASVATP